MKDVGSQSITIGHKDQGQRSSESAEDIAGFPKARVKEPEILKTKNKKDVNSGYIMDIMDATRHQLEGARAAR